jgi:dihydrofolate synthase/folylpolyglutamate synthase
LIPGRPRWLVDVGHNEQAAFAIGEALAFHGRGGYVVCLVGMMADKDPAKFAGALDPHVNTWVTCTIDGDRGLSGEVLATMIGPEVTKPVLAADCLEVAMQRAISHTPPDGLVVVCGSFHIAGPALQMLLPRTTVL